MFIFDQKNSGANYISPRRIYVDAAGVVVEEDDPSVARLLVAEGGMISHEEAEAAGLLTPVSFGVEIQKGGDVTVPEADAPESTTTTRTRRTKAQIKADEEAATKPE